MSSQLFEKKQNICNHMSKLIAKGEKMKEKIKLLDNKNGNTSYSFICPACKVEHMINVKVPKNDAPCWDWNNSTKKPTIRPSIRVKGGSSTGGTVCHMYVTDGKIQYLGDCTHEKAGKTIDMESVKSGYERS